MTERPAFRWVLVAFLFATSALNYCDRSAIAAVLPLLRADLHLSTVALGAIGSLFLWAFTAAAPFGGMLADSVPRGRLIALCLAVWSLLTLATGFAANAGQLLGLRLLLGLAEASYLPAALALIADYHPTRTRATAIGIHSAGQPFGAIAGAAGLGYLADRWGWRPGFFVLGGSGLLLAVVAGGLLRGADDRGRAARPGPPGAAGRRALPKWLAPASIFKASKIVDLLRQPTYASMVAAGMIVSVGSWIFLFWLPLYFRETYRLTLGQAGLAGTFMLQVASMAGGILGGLFSDRFAGRRPWRRMWLQIACYALAAPFLLIFLSPRPAFGLLNCCIFLYSFCLWFGAANVLSLTCDLLPPDSRATAISLISASGTLAGGAGVFLAGPLKTVWGLGGVFAAISGLTLLAAAVLLSCCLVFPEPKIGAAPA